ncbi:hypothetical protein [Cerasicoccus fimbriatus]|uniref:hypothetical protein n=1 Tax=Cerasicoccus fimbriatus TaxID=3014554 RepID=UPI0022B404FB|nr:hypothetical protein [Cerasicoccus sp. TK19100]
MHRLLLLSTLLAVWVLTGCANLETSEQELDYSTKMKAQQADREAEQQSIRTSGFQNYHDQPAQTRF